MRKKRRSELMSGDEVDWAVRDHELNVACDEEGNEKCVRERGRAAGAETRWPRQKRRM